MTTEALLSTTRAAERLGYTPARFRALVREGRGPTPVVRGTPGRAGFYAVEELERWALTHRKWEKLPPASVPTPKPPKVLPEGWTVVAWEDGNFSAAREPSAYTHKVRRRTYEGAVDIAEMYYVGAEDDTDFWT